MHDGVVHQPFGRRWSRGCWSAQPERSEAGRASTEHGRPASSDRPSCVWTAREAIVFSRRGPRGCRGRGCMANAEQASRLDARADSAIWWRGPWVDELGRTGVVGRRVDLGGADARRPRRGRRRVHAGCRTRRRARAAPARRDMPTESGPGTSRSSSEAGRPAGTPADERRPTPEERGRSGRGSSLATRYRRGTRRRPDAGLLGQPRNPRADWRAWLPTRTTAMSARGGSA